MVGFCHGGNVLSSHGDDHGDVNHLLLLPVQEEPDGAHSKTD